MKRPLPDGTTHLLFTGLKLLRRLASLVPPPRTNLSRPLRPIGLLSFLCSAQCVVAVASSSRRDA